MEKILSVITVVSLMAVIFSFSSTNRNSNADEIEEINTVIDNFQTAYTSQSTTDLRRLFYANSVIAWDSKGGERQAVYSLEQWLQGTQEDVFDSNQWLSDELTDRDITVMRNIAYCVCEYTYRDEDGTQRGFDVFTFLRMRGTWKILSLQWTGDAVE